jgi:hypothetical protein
VSGDNLVVRLLDQKSTISDAAVAEAVRTADDEALATALRSARGWHRVVLAAAAGDLRQPGSSDAVLKELAGSAGPGTRDLRCTSLVAITKRTGVAATPVLLDALSQRDPAVREYAVLCLAAVGDARAWDAVLEWLRRRTQPARTIAPPSQAAVHYLIRHLPERTEDDRREVVRVIRKAWPVLAAEGTTQWLSAIWPAVEPDGPMEPGTPPRLDAADWRRHAVFAAPAVARL